MPNNITTEAIAVLVRSHGTIAAPDVGKHFGQPYWNSEIESAAKPLIESGQITISASRGVVWNHNIQGDLDSTQGFQNEALLEKVPGLYCTSTPKLTRPEQKQRAANSLTDWSYQHHTPLEWVRLLDEGHTICTGAFVKVKIPKKNDLGEVEIDDSGNVVYEVETDSDGKVVFKMQYTHQSEGWRGTQFVFADTDVTTLDNHPDAPEPFTDPHQLFELYPQLPNEAFSIGHSLSSLSTAKPPPHVRARTGFLLEQIITRIDDYDALLRGLAKQYPMISTGRQPAQPVFGNAGHRRYYEEGKVRVCKEQRFSTKIFGNVLTRQRVLVLIEIGRQNANVPTETTVPQAATSTSINKDKLTPEQMKEILSFIPADDYPDQWFPVGCALHREGYDFEIWDQWSSKSDKYQPQGMRKKWESFAKQSVKSKVKPITIATIYRLAMDNGWQPPARQQYRHGYHTHRLMNRR